MTSAAETGGVLQQEDQARLLFDESPIGVIICDADGIIRRVNAALLRFLSRDEREVLGRNVEEFSLEEDVRLNLAARTRVLADGQPVQIEKRYVRGDGTTVTGQLTLHKIVDGSGNELLLGYVLDVTARRSAEEQLRHETLHDRVTGLPGRALFLDRLAQRLLRGDGGMIIVLGLDRFVTVNQAFGHATGDRILYEVARRIERAVPRGTSVARIGGDEFGLILNDEDAIGVIDQVRAAGSPRVAVEGREIVLTCSAGVRLTDPEEKPETLLRDATLALQRAKEQGRDRIVQYRGSMRAKVSRQVEIEGALRRALDRGEIRVFYQPIHRTSDGGLAGFEALVRWMHPELGFVSPAEFIPVAEADGLIRPIGAFVLDESIRQLALWRGTRQDAFGLSVSINLSTVQLHDPGHIHDLRRRVLRAPIPPEKIKFEMTESVFIDIQPSVVSAITALRDTGAQLVLDDFGTGWSSLNYLQGLPFDGLKVDRSFVQRSMDEPRSRNLLKGIASLAHGIEMHCVAEGVETAPQRSFVADAGFDFAQGYLFARPGPPEQVFPLTPG